MIQTQGTNVEETVLFQKPFVGKKNFFGFLVRAQFASAY